MRRPTSRDGRDEMFVEGSLFEVSNDSCRRYGREYGLGGSDYFKSALGADL